MFFFVTLLILTGFTKTTSESFKVVGPALPLIVDQGEDVVLPCSLQPNISAVDMKVEWFKLEVTTLTVLVYEDHKDRNDGQDVRFRGRTSLFEEELKNGNTSLKLSGIRPADEGVYNCLIEFSTGYDDVNVYLNIRGQVFPAWKISLICISIFGLGLLLSAACISKGSPLHPNRKLLPALCSAIAYLRLHSENVRNEWNLMKYYTSQEGYRRLIPAITNCRKAQLAGFNLTEESITTLRGAPLSENSSLKELDLSYSDLQGSGQKKFSDGLMRLEIIRLTICALSEEFCDDVQLALKSENSCLKELDFRYNDLQNSGVEKICAGLKSSHCKLVTLRLAGCNLTDELFNTLNEALQSVDSCLKKLDLSYSDLQGSRLGILSDGLKRLETLRLTMCKLSEDSCGILCSVLQSENHCMKNLDLSENKLEDVGVEKLCAGLTSPHCNLETLRLAVCGLGEQTCEWLSSILQLENSLKELDLSNNDLQDSGVEKLCEGLKSSHCKMETLRLSGCMVTEKGCFSLASALSSNYSLLKELDLSYNHPGDTGVKLLYEKKEDTGCSLDTLWVHHAGKIRIDQSPKKYACELTLDQNTVNRFLSLSEGNRKVTHVMKEQSYPDHPERFSDRRLVLCKESLTGRCYWKLSVVGG